MFRKYLQICILVVVVALWALAASATSLRVALYPYVPRIDQFRSVIAEHWQSVHLDVDIAWVDGWDGGYKSNPQDDYDVYVFDATYLTHFRTHGWLLGLTPDQIQDVSDFLPFAINGVLKDGRFWAIPQLGCTEYLIFDKSDVALRHAVTMSNVVEALGRCTYHGEIPPSGTGLMMDFSGGTTNAIYYVKSVEAITGTFPIRLPYNEHDVDRRAMANLRTILATQSLRNAWYSGESHQRALWYGQNHGRAYVGYSESLTRVPEERLPSIAMKVMPWSDNAGGLSRPLFYVDAIGIHPKSQERGTEALAIELANLMASTPVIVESFMATESEGPQFLTPVRESAMNQLATAYPAYAAIRDAVEASGRPILLDLGLEARGWIASMKDTIKHMVIDELQCYCDVRAGPPMDNRRAQEVCPQVCGADSWNGQWTNKDGYSVCGCFCGVH